MDVVNNKFYRTVWVSDLHLGTRGCQAEAFLDFLRGSHFETLYLVGDIIDIWALKRGIYWPQVHNDVLQKLLRSARKGARVIYIPGNHDEFVGRFTGHYGNISIQRRAIHTTVDGRRLLVIHGHEMDTVTQNLRWLAHVGDLGYKGLMGLNGLVNYFRKRLGMGYWSLSAFVKKEVKNVVSFIGQYEESIARYAREYSVAGVVCGHIHSPAARMIGDVYYFNSGDWVESCTALVENLDGSLEIIKDSDPFLHKLKQPTRHASVSSIKSDVIDNSHTPLVSKVRILKNFLTDDENEDRHLPGQKVETETKWVKTISSVSK